MLFFYYILIFFSIYSFIFIYNKDNISYIFKTIIYQLNYKVDNDVETIIKNLPSKIIIVSSHTSIYDFLIGIIFYYGYLHKRFDTYILMKKDFEILVKYIIKLFDKKIKLISVNSNKNQKLTDIIYDNLINKNNYILYIAPEGTRSCTNNLRSGYWILSKKLDIDVVYLGIDFLKKTISIENNRKVEDIWDDEKDYFIKTCKKYVPLYPERCYWTKDYYE
jgi:1-acyl-sn-glycerol-3-phosphate acyltransferase